MSDARIAYTVATAAEATSLSRDSIRRAIAAGNLPVHYANARPLILHADLVAWLEACPTVAPKERAS